MGPRTSQFDAAVGRVLHDAIASPGAVGCHEINIDATLEGNAIALSTLTADYMFRALSGLVLFQGREICASKIQCSVNVRRDRARREARATVAQ